MIEIIFSYLNRLKNKLSTISKEGTVDMYGAGDLGNVCYTANSTAPEFLKWDHVFNTGTTYPMPLTRAAHYKNLYIDTGVTLKSYSEVATIMVSDTLYLRGNISCSNTHTGKYYCTPNVPQYLTNLKIFGETNFLPSIPFCITGGTDNPIFGNHAAGGGLCAIYYTDLLSLASGSDRTDTTDNIQLSSYTNVNGGTGTSTAGGCLIIAARNIAIASSGRFQCFGGNGTGTSKRGVLLDYNVLARTPYITK